VNLQALYECMAHPDRLRIVALLGQRPLCVQALERVLQLSQVEVSKHLAYLRNLNFVEVLKSRTWRIYQLPAELSFEFSQHLRCLQDCIREGSWLNEELARLAALPVRVVKHVSRLQERGTPEQPQESVTDPAPGTLEDHLL